ncbi:MULTISPECIES: LytTR family DNA-binding domain-containing protein [Sphingopyxis]|uniref:LytTR family DNA-binding domain-containing protein n=1 Tax=Sphingopyxis TaxID=165697 RepID=UPI001645DE9F|nr:MULTISPECIES: LytTR family DNA-binding domain-containing protein [Sphingopyxis]QXF10737.1 LytTR family transcriptional regulator [Sphingopyxis terrae subsp. terrae]
MAKRLTIELLAMIALGLLIGLLGPFGTFNNPPAIRMLNWVMWLLAGYVFYRPTGVVAGWLCDATGLPPLGGRLIALIVASVPVTLVVTMMAMQMSFGEALRWPGFWTMYLYISIVSAVVVGVMGLSFRPRADDDPPPAPETPITAPAAAPPAAPPPTPVAPQPDAALPLPPGFGAILALKGEDHYVRVIGTRSEELILMRMRDAIARLDDADGLRIHRSWWVARAAVAAVRRDGRTAMVTLTSGHEAPVARDMMPELRAAGWI